MIDENMPVLTYPVLLSIVKEKANYYCTPLNKYEGFIDVDPNGNREVVYIKIKNWDRRNILKIKKVLPNGVYEMTIKDLSYILDCIIHKLTNPKGGNNGKIKGGRGSNN